MIKTVLSIAIVPILLITSQTLLKKGLTKMGGIQINSWQSFLESFFKLFQEKYIYLGVAIAIISAFIWLIIISKNELTLAFPVSSAIFFIILFLSSWLFLKEDITIFKITGTIIIILGIALITK
jgi:drug/metabolite transporter (DMT)-like permease